MEEKIVFEEDIKLEEIELVGKDSLGQEYYVKSFVFPDEKKGELIFDNFGERKKDFIENKVTHRKCPICGKVYSKKEDHYCTKKMCSECRKKEEEKEELKRYMSLPLAANVEFPLMIYHEETFFLEKDELRDYIFDMVEDEDTKETFQKKINNIKLVTTNLLKIPYLNLREILDESSIGEGVEDSFSEEFLGLDNDKCSIYELEKLLNRKLGEMYNNGIKLYENGNQRVDVNKIININDFFNDEGLIF